MRPVLFLAPIIAAGCEPRPTFFEPSAFYVEGVFAYDPAIDAAVPYTVDGDPVPPTVRVTVASDAYFESFSDADRCTVTLLHTGPRQPPRAGWTESAGAWFGFDLVAGDVESDCTGWDPAHWGDDPAAVVTAWEWGLGIGPFDPDVLEEVEAAVVAQDGQETWDETWVPAVFGGGFRWSGATDRFDGGFAPNGYAYALLVDEDFVLVLQGESAVAIPVEDITDGSLPAAAYTIASWFGMDAALLAPTNL